MEHRRRRGPVKRIREPDEPGSTDLSSQENKVPTTKDNRPFISVDVMSNQFESLVDTGSQVTALSFSSYQQLFRKVRPPIHPLRYALTAANGTRNQRTLYGEKVTD